MKWAPEPPMHNLINCNVLAKFPVNEDIFFLQYSELKFIPVMAETRNQNNKHSN